MSSPLAHLFRMQRFVDEHSIDELMEELRQSDPILREKDLVDSLQAMCQFTLQASKDRPLLAEARARAKKLCGYQDLEERNA